MDVLTEITRTDRSDNHQKLLVILKALFRRQNSTPKWADTGINLTFKLHNIDDAGGRLQEVSGADTDT